MTDRTDVYLQILNSPVRTTVDKTLLEPLHAAIAALEQLGYTVEIENLADTDVRSLRILNFRMEMVRVLSFQPLCFGGSWVFSIHHREANVERHVCASIEDVDKFLRGFLADGHFRLFLADWAAKRDSP